jgi:Rrf2 family protein
MFRLSKTTDYGIVLMAQLASDSGDASPARHADPVAESGGKLTTTRASQNARELAESSDLPVPMVSKILKALAKEGLLISQRGSKGGYSLARAPEDLQVAEMIRVLEGPVALTDCAIGPAHCEHETMCAVREPWQRISRVVERALEDVTLADLVNGHGRPGSTGSASATLQIDRSEPTHAARDQNTDRVPDNSSSSSSSSSTSTTTTTNTATATAPGRPVADDLA